MARSPYQGMYNSGVRPTVVQAPDALVLINGETDLIGCASCRRRFDLNKYITAFTVDLSVDSVPGSASISLSIPRHSLDDFLFEGVPVITPMMEVEIFAKGAFLVEGVPQYYPIFWGLITEVSDAYDSGEHSYTIQCSDILKWWELCKMNINPAFTQAAGQQGRNIFGNVYFGANPYDVIWSLAQMSFGDVVVGSGSLTSMVKEQGSQRQVFTEALKDLMSYWADRFTRIRNQLLLYGTNGVAVRGDTLYEAMSKTTTAQQRYASTAVRNANGGKEAGQMVFDPTDPGVVAFRTQFTQAGQVNFWQSEFQTKLELATAAKEVVGFEFYMDVTGDIVFKPPFFNLDILSNKPVSWIQDVDIINWDFSESEAEVVTQVQMQGNFGGSVDYGLPEEVTPFTSVTDYHLLRQYGWRTHSYNSEFMGDPMLMFYHGLDILDRLNSKRHRGSVTIPMRSELRLGFPVYVPSKDQTWYVGGISHSFQRGGRCTTSLSLTARRQKFFAPKGIGKMKLKSFNPPGAGNQQAIDPSKAQKTAPLPGSDPTFKYTSRQLSRSGKFQLDIGMAATMPPTASTFDMVNTTSDNPYDPLILRHPKTGRAVGYPNVVMVYTRPFTPQPNDLKAAAGQKRKPNPQLGAEREKALKERFDAAATELSNTYSHTKEDALRAKHLNNRFSYGLNSAGVFIYAHESTKVISEMLLLPTTSLEAKTPDGQTVQPVPKGTAMIRPVSDERGFEVIGHFRYGRGLALRDGALIQGDPNARASIGVQLAISGDLWATLAAQSSGITAIKTSADANPADTLARLTVEDLQSGGLINSQTGKPEFVGGQTTFVTAAPLGSPNQKGYPVSVEAGQLSKALTLAEMLIYRPGLGVDKACGCLLGRRDLAFLQNGYQVKVLSSTEPANSLLGPDGADPTSPTAPVENRTLLSPAQAAEFVENFLFDLYRITDEVHQQTEAALRGELLSIEFPTRDDRINGVPAEQESNFAPPFNPASRLAAGDPVAIAQQASSAASDIAESWNKFGQDVKSSAQKATLQGRLDGLRKDQNDLQKQVTQLQAMTFQAGTLLPFKPRNAAERDQEVKALQDQLKDIQQSVNRTQAELDQLS